MRWGRRPGSIRVADGERLLADAVAEGARLGGTRDAFYAEVPSATGLLRIPWEAVHDADWDADTSTLTVTEVGQWGKARPRHVYVVREPGRLLELLRERVTASVVLQRHVPIDGRRGVRVVGRRPPSGNGEVVWLYEFDEGIDPTDARVRAAARAALEQAQAEIGAG